MRSFVCFAKPKCGTYSIVCLRFWFTGILLNFQAMASRRGGGGGILIGCGYFNRTFLSWILKALRVRTLIQVLGFVAIWPNALERHTIQEWWAYEFFFYWRPHQGYRNSWLFRSFIVTNKYQYVSTPVRSLPVYYVKFIRAILVTFPATCDSSRTSTMSAPSIYNKQRQEYDDIATIKGNRILALYSPHVYHTAAGQRQRYHGSFFFMYRCIVTVVLRLHLLQTGTNNTTRLPLISFFYWCPWLTLIISNERRWYSRYP